MPAESATMHCDKTARTALHTSYDQSTSMHYAKTARIARHANEIPGEMWFLQACIHHFSNLHRDRRDLCNSQPASAASELPVAPPVTPCGLRLRLRLRGQSSSGKASSAAALVTQPHGSSSSFSLPLGISSK